MKNLKAKETIQAIKLNLRAMWGRAFVRVVGANREPFWIISETILPVLALSSYIFVYRALKAPPEFEGFVVIGGVMTAYWLNILWSMASQFYWEKMSGQLELFFISPMHIMSLLTGMAFGGLLMTSTRAVVILIIGILVFNVNFVVTSWIALILAFIFTMSSLYGLGMCMASLFMLFGREAWHLSNLLTEPVYFLSGFYFPLSSLGFWVSLVASIIPVSLGLDAIRQLLFTPQKAFPFLHYNIEILILIGLTIIYLLTSFKALKAMEKKGKEEATLSLRWQ